MVTKDDIQPSPRNIYFMHIRICKFLNIILKLKLRHFNDNYDYFYYFIPSYFICWFSRTICLLIYRISPVMKQKFAEQKLAIARIHVQNTSQADC